jgi:tol-pal system protein YbgF
VCSAEPELTGRARDLLTVVAAPSYDRSVRRISVSIAVLLGLGGATTVVGCGGAAGGASRPVASSSVTSAESEIRGLRQREQELEGRLALAEAEVVDLRDRLREAESESRRRTVRIGRERGASFDEAASVQASDPAAEVVEAEASTEGPRPVLELVGAPAVRSVTVPSVEAWVGPPPPPGVEERLPVVPLEGSDAPGRYSRQMAARVAATPATRLATVPAEGPVRAPGSSGAATVDDAITEYRAALELVHARQLERALAALTAFIGRHPEHAHAAGARYWRAEVRYAQREYALALAGFEELLRIAPAHARAADALLKVGLCHQRMGDLARAHLTFQRVQRQFPDTEAARAASRQDAS